MDRYTRSIPAAAVLGQAVGLLGFIDPFFIPLVLLCPVVTGAIAAANGVRYVWIASLWVSAGLCMAWTDWLLNREDVAFHLGLAVVMPLIAGAGYGAVRLVRRRTTVRP